MAKSFGARFLAHFAVSILCAAATAAYAAKAPQWTITDIGGLPSPFGNTSFAEAVNNRGEVTGWSYSGQFVPVHHGFLWSNGEMQDLGVPEGMYESNMTALNNHGVVVGAASGPPHGGSMVAVWKDGQWFVPGVEGSAFDVNDHGVAVGYFMNGPYTHAFMLKEGVVHDLGTLGGTTSIARAISHQSVVVGNSSLPGDQQRHAFVWEAGVMTDIGTLGGANSSARDVNHHGTVVGNSQDATGRIIAMIYDSAGMRPLFNLPGESSAKSINDKGAVVGSMDSGSFLYDDGVLTRLESIPEVIAAGWTRLAPNGINDRGWIVGTGSHNGQSRSFVLMPR
jgi:probable HAF family extracellular repeat protein